MDFAAYWQYTDIVTKFLFFSLLGLSIASWIAGILRLYQSSQLKSTVAADLTQAVSAESKNLSALGSSERKPVVSVAPNVIRVTRVWPYWVPQPPLLLLLGCSGRFGVSSMLYIALVSQVKPVLVKWQVL